MKKIILTIFLAYTTTVMAHHETISSELTKKFVETKPTVNLNHFSDSMVASGWGSVRLTTYIDCSGTSSRTTCLTNENQSPWSRCGAGDWVDRQVGCESR